MISTVTFSDGGSQRANGPQPSKKGRIPGPAGEGKGASRLSTVKWSFKMRFRRASCTVWIVALLPEPWKAISVGFVELPVLDMLGGVVLRVKKVVEDPSAAM